MKKLFRISGTLLLLAVLLSVMTPAKEVRADASKRYTVIVIENATEITYSSGDKVIYTTPEILDSTKAAALQFADSLFQQGVDDYVAVVYYDQSGAHVVSGFVSDLNVVKKSINSIKRNYGFNMEAGLLEAENLLHDIDCPNKNVIVINTGCNDGDDSRYDYNGHYKSSVVGNSWEWTSTGICSYAYANTAYDAAVSLKKCATVYSIGVFNIFEDMPSRGDDIVALQKMLARDIASDGEYYLEADGVEQVSDKMHEIWEKYRQQVYTVTPVSSDGSLGSITGGGNVLEGDSVTVRATPADHSRFLGWYIGDKLVSTDAEYTYVPSKETVAPTARFQRVLPVAATVNSPLYGSVSCPDSIGLGDTVKYKAKPGVGYKFVGWYRDGVFVSSENPYRFIADENNTNLHAVFSLDESLDEDALARQAENSDLPTLLLEGHPDKSMAKLTWTDAGDDVVYEIYRSLCDGKKNYKKAGETAKRSFTIKNLDKDKAYKFFVTAYKYIDGNKVYTAKALNVHVAFPGYGKTNVKAVSVGSANVTIKEGGKTKIKASAAAQDKKKKIVDHTAAFRYVTSDRSIATVNKNGVIKARKKGACTVYVLANNGVRKAVKVTVK